MSMRNTENNQVNQSVIYKDGAGGAKAYNMTNNVQNRAGFAAPPNQ